MKKLGFKGTNIEPYWDLVKRIISESDLVLEVLDARLIEMSRNEQVETLIEEVDRPVIYVINKSDLVSKKDLEKQIEVLKEKGKPIVFVSAKNSKSIKILLYIIKKVFKEYGKRAPTLKDKSNKKLKYREAKAGIVVGILGYPNVGKSSIINALCHKKKVQVSKTSGTTRGIHWIKLDDEIKLIDSPGVIPLKKEDDIKYGLIGARDSEKLRNPELVADAIIMHFLANNPRAFEKFYEISISDEDKNNNNSYNILLQIAKKKNFLLKGGVLDENRTSTIIIRDWQEGRLRL